MAQIWCPGSRINIHYLLTFFCIMCCHAGSCSLLHVHFCWSYDWHIGQPVETCLSDHWWVLLLCALCSLTFALLLIVIWKAAHCMLFPNRHRSIIVVLVYFSYCFLVREMTHSKFVSVCTFSYWFQSHCNVLSRFSAQNCYTHEFAIFSNTLIACEDNIPLASQIAVDALTAMLLWLSLARKRS